MHRLILTCLLLAHCLPTRADALREGPSPTSPADARIGELLPDLSFTDLDGKPGKLSDYRNKPLVLCMTSITCPVARRYTPTLAGLVKRYQGKVDFLLINPMPAEVPGRIKAVATQFGARYVHDRDVSLASRLGATSSTECFLLDGARTLTYRGAIDDQFGLGYALPSPRRTLLTNAIDALLAGQQPTIPSTTAPGCAIESRDVAIKNQTLTYHDRVSRIIQNKCQECHRPGEAAPFSLLTYEDAKSRARNIARVVGRGVMPPWRVEHPKNVWANDLGLTEREKNDLLGWIDQGTPEGDPADAPIARTFTQGWRIGQPGAVWESPRAFSVPAAGTVEYQHVRVPTNLTEDRWVRAVEIRPTAPRVVHHVLAFVVFPDDHPRKAEQPDFRGGIRGYFAGMVPGSGHHVFPEGTAKFLPRGATLILQIHYTPDGEPAEDRPKVGVVFTDKPQNELVTRSAFNNRFLIPPGDDNYEVVANHTFAQPTRLYSFSPHSHVRGKAYRYELFRPGNDTPEVLLDLPRYDFNWQLEYRLRTPLDVPAGSKLKVTAWFDNSDKNPANPDPKRAVPFGEQTSDEMMIGYFTGHPLEGAKP